MITLRSLFKRWAKPGLRTEPFISFEEYSFIEDLEFADRENLISAVFPETLEEIGQEAFARSDLKQVDFSKCVNLTLIGDSAFCETKLTELDLTSCKKLEKIDDSAFSRCEGLRSVSFPASLTQLGSYAFALCPLKSVVLPPALEIIAGGAFFACHELSSITFPASLKSIKKEAFLGCQSLVSVDLSGCQHLKEIRERAFKDCLQLESITLPSSLKTMKDMVFSDCSQLKRIVFKGSTSEVHFLDFYGRDMGPIASHLDELGIPSDCTLEEASA